MRHTLKELGHPQPQTPIQTDNKTANNLLTNKIMPKSFESHGHAIPLVALLQHSRTMSILLETRNTKFS
jgi:hypothetical protein